VRSSGLVDEKNWKNHTPASAIIGLDRFFSFCFVRNPYDRIYSSYNFYKNNPKRGNKRVKEMIQTYETFETFVSSFRKSKKIDKKHFRAQASYICNRRMKIIIDYVGKFEKINEDWMRIQDINPYCKQLMELPVRNQTSGREKKIYTKEMADIIYNNYWIDFQMFNYERDSWRLI